MSFYVGIDIAKFKHDCFIVTGDGEVIRNSFSFPNNEEGFKELREALDQLDHSQKIKVGLEATGHYGRNLKQFLSSIGYEYSELNPYLVKKYSESITLRRTKTDKKDAELIAKYLQFEASKSNPPSSYNNYELKVLVRSRDKLVRARSDQLVVITNCLDRMFPEFKGFFDNRLGKCALSILSKLKTPEKIAKMNNEQIVNFHNIGRSISVDKLMRLKDLAKVTIGNSSNADTLVMIQAIKIHDVIDDNITEIEQSIKAIMKDIKSPIETIPGIGTMSAASIIAEYGDINRFASPDKLLAYAGLECSKHQSGNEDFKGKMVKHGSAHLRYVLMNIAISVKNHCPTFAAYYLKKRDEGKCYRVALNHVVRKLLRVIFKLISINESYNLSLSK